MERFLAAFIYVFALQLLFSANLCSQGAQQVTDRRILIMRETGEMQDGLPVMEQVPDTSALFASVERSIKNSFLDRFLDLYRLCQCYLVGEDQQQVIEPAYLALTDHQGGFAKQGFVLQTPLETLMKEVTPYVDITEGAATGDLSGLMSVTQLLPHEMGHVMFRLLSPEDTLANNNRSVDMHYFSIITDYPTAFNEGFAEHLENVSRHYEKNDSIRKGIEADIRRIENTSKHAINGFTRDFRFPFRLGFYKAGMINWYQRYEDYKRDVFAKDGRIRYKNKSIKLQDPENMLSYRNAGIALDENIRNIVQFHATEGAISAFFTALTLRDHPVAGITDSLFHFICDAAPVEMDPLQFQFLKYFHVLHHYVVQNNSTSSQFSDFVRGYIESFPEEEGDVLRIYRALAGHEFTPDLPEPLWLLVPDHPHRLLALDPFGAIEVPIYTFNLNASEVEDLLTIRGITRRDAEKIIHFRDTQGYFNRLEDLMDVSGLPPEKADLICSVAFDQPEFERIMDEFDSELSIGRMLIIPVLHVVFRALISFIPVFLLLLYLLRKSNELKLSKLIGNSLRYLFLWVGLVLLELIILFLFPQYWLISLITVILVLGGGLLVYRGNKKKLKLAFWAFSLMFIFSLVSIL